MRPGPAIYAHIAKLILASLVIWGLWRAASHARQDVAARELRLQDLKPMWLVASSGLYVLAQWPVAMFWRQVLDRLDVTVGRWPAYEAFFLGHVGKYVPSKLLVIVLRASFVSRTHVDLPVAAASVFIETLTTMAAGAALASLLLLVAIPAEVRMRVVAGGMFAICFAGSLPATLRFIARRMLVRRWGDRLWEAFRRVDFSLMAAGWAWGLLSWSLMGASLYASALGVQAFPDSDVTRADSILLLIRMTAAISLSVVAGFVSMLPGGLLVREWVMTQLLQPACGSTLALAVPVALRANWLLTEVALSGIILLMRKLRKKYR